ncbi:MAG: hypothetical protein WCW14_02395 [Candidatus Paceibacterota bacterium]|jgi:hypothetical protein
MEEIKLEKITSENDSETITVEDLKRFKALEAKGFVKHFFDDSIETHRVGFNELISQANENGWEKETIFKGKYVYVFVRESQ